MIRSKCKNCQVNIGVKFDCDICSDGIVRVCNICRKHYSGWTICVDCALICDHCGENDITKFGYYSEMMCGNCNNVSCGNCMTTKNNNKTCKDCENE